MTMIEEIEQKFGKNNPFTIDEVISEKYSYDVVRKMLSSYVQEGLLKRYSQGVYFFPKMTVLGESIPAFSVVVKKKYIETPKGIQGYITGLNLLNQIGLTTQVPNDVEIATNLEKTKKRTVKIRERNVILRQPNHTITEENVKYLQFLDIFKYATIDQIISKKKNIIEVFDNQNMDEEILLYYISKSTPMIKVNIRKSRIYDEIAFRKNNI